MSELLDVLRTEQKYILNPLEYAHMEYILSSILHRDTHSVQKAYKVRSLYFDTPDNRDFYDKVDGLEIRRKIRLRIYDPNTQYSKLELKEKQDGLQRKRSLTLTRMQAISVCEGNYEVLKHSDNEFAWELYTRMQQFCYRPKCIVEYDRMAFVVPENDIRVTLDSNLRAGEGQLNLFDPNLSLYPVGIPGEVTMEVKFNGFLLNYVKDIVSLPEKMRSSRSKYCMARNIILRDEF